MADAILSAPQTPSIEGIPHLFEEAYRVSSISEERFGVDRQKTESVRTDDLRVLTVAAEMVRLSVPNLARLSVGDYLESYGYDLDQADAVKAFLTEKRRAAQAGSAFQPNELAGLALPIYLAKQEEAVREAAGGDPIIVSRFSDSLQGAVVTTHPDVMYRAAGVTGTIERVNMKRALLELTPVPEANADSDIIHHVEPVKTAGKHQGKRQVRIEAAPIDTEA